MATNAQPTHPVERAGSTESEGLDAPRSAEAAEIDRAFESPAGCLSETLAVVPALLAALGWATNRDPGCGSDAQEATK